MEDKKITGFLATFLSLGISLLLIVSGAVLYWLYEQYAAQKEAGQNQTQPLSAPQPINQLPPFPTEPELNPEEILLLLTEEFPEKKDSLEVFINRQSGSFSAGSFQTDEPFVSGWWLAVNQDDNWQLIGQGSGNITCQAIEGFGLPLDLVPECYDLKTGGIVDRATEVTVIAPQEATQTP